jgi:hypothetical protein
MSPGSFRTPRKPPEAAKPMLEPLQAPAALSAPSQPTGKVATHWPRLHPIHGGCDASSSNGEQNGRGGTLQREIFQAFEAIAAALRAAVGRPDMVEFNRTIGDAHSFSGLEDSIRQAVSDIGLMLFLELDPALSFARRAGGNHPRPCGF